MGAGSSGVGAGSSPVSAETDELEETGQNTALTRRGLMVVSDS